MIRRRLLSYSVGILTVSLLTAGAQAEARFITGSPRTEKVNAAAAQRPAPTVAGRWVGTKAIIFDPSTRSLRKPTQLEVFQMVRSIQQLTTRPAKAIKGTIASNGTTRQGSINGAFATIILGRARVDGSVETRCVQTFEEATEFLGLVDQTDSQQ